MQNQRREAQKSGLIVCAWCSRYLGPMKGAVGVSHGICLDCKRRELARWGAGNPFVGVHGTHHAHLAARG
jgi:hypothetical protein